MSICFLPAIALTTHVPPAQASSKQQLFWPKASKQKQDGATWKYRMETEENNQTLRCLGAVRAKKKGAGHHQCALFESKTACWTEGLCVLNMAAAALCKHLNMGFKCAKAEFQGDKDMSQSHRFFVRSLLRCDAAM